MFSIVFPPEDGAIVIIHLLYTSSLQGSGTVGSLLAGPSHPEVGIAGPWTGGDDNH